MPYNNKQISKEIDLTISGENHYGNSLRVAKDFPIITPQERIIIDRLLISFKTSQYKINLKRYKNELMNISRKIRYYGE